MKQQTISHDFSAKAPAGTSRPQGAVVMGQGLVTPTVREHLRKTVKTPQTSAKPQSVVMGQGLVTPAVREHLSKAQRRQFGDKR